MPSKIYIKTSKSKIQNIIATFLNRHIGIQKKKQYKKPHLKNKQMNKKTI